MTRIRFLALLLAALAFCAPRPAHADDLRDRVRLIIDKMARSTWDRDEDPAAQTQRLDLTADAIAQASRHDFDAAALLTIAEYETHFAGYVSQGCHYPEGIPRGAPHCDQGAARTYWQLHERACPAGWSCPRGSSEALVEFALCARIRFTRYLESCHGRHPGGRLAGGFAAYPKGDCTREGSERDGARARARGLQRRLFQLHQAKQAKGAGPPDLSSAFLTPGQYHPIAATLSYQGPRVEPRRP